MADTNNGVEIPSGDERNEVLTTTQSLLNTLRNKVNDAQRNQILDLIKKEDLSKESFKNISTLINAAQNMYAKNPIETMRILNALVNAGADGTVTAQEVMQAGKNTVLPKDTNQINVLIEKFKEIFEQLTVHLGSLGFSTLKMIEKMMGKSTFLGNLMLGLKNSDKAKVVDTKNALTKAGVETIADGKTYLDLAREIDRQLKELPKTRQLPAEYEFDSHLNAVMAKVDTTNNTVSVESFRTAGAEVEKELPLKPATPPAPAAPVVTPPATNPTAPTTPVAPAPTNP